MAVGIPDTGGPVSPFAVFCTPLQSIEVVRKQPEGTGLISIDDPSGVGSA